MIHGMSDNQQREMTIKDTKTWLYRVWVTEQELKVELEELDRIEESAKKVTATLSGMPGSPSKDPHFKIENAAIRAAEIRSRVEYLEQLKSETAAAINRLEKSQYRTILKLRHIQCKTWYCIADAMNYSPRGVFSLYKRALKALSELL